MIHNLIYELKNCSNVELIKKLIPLSAKILHGSLDDNEFLEHIAIQVVRLQKGFISLETFKEHNTGSSILEMLNAKTIQVFESMKEV